MWGCCAVISKKISNGSFCEQFQIHPVVLCHPYDVMRKHIFQSHQDPWKRLVLARSDGVKQLHAAAMTCRGMCWIHCQVHLSFQSARVFIFCLVWVTLAPLLDRVVFFFLCSKCTRLKTPGGKSDRAIKVSYNQVKLESHIVCLYA